MQMTCRMPDHGAVVNAMLEGFVRACQVIIESGLAPVDPLEARVRYQLEPAGQEDWKLPQNVMRDGWGDCEDLAGWRAAGLRATGEDPDATCVVMRTGPGKLHAVVMRGDGSVDDVCMELMQMGRAAGEAAASISGFAVGAKKKKKSPIVKVTHGKAQDVIDRKHARAMKHAEEKQAAEDEAQAQADQAAADAAAAQAAAYASPASQQMPAMDPYGYFGGGSEDPAGDELAESWNDQLEAAFEV